MNAPSIWAESDGSTLGSTVTAVVTMSNLEKFLLVADGHILLKRIINSKANWCNGCNVLLARVGRVGLLVQFRVGVMYVSSSI